MITSLAEFEGSWGHESNLTRKMMAPLTDGSLAQAVTSDHRTLGRLAWHVTTSIAEMMTRTGLTIAGPQAGVPLPASAEQIRKGYDEAAASLLAEVKSKWTDASLEIEDEMYGETWKRAFTLMVLIHHQIHHRGQMTVLMRQAGLKVPGIYGPSRDEWAQWGMSAPEV